MAGARVEINRHALQELVHDSSERAAYRAAEVTRDRAAANVRATGRVDSGRLANSFFIEEDPTGGRGQVWFRVYTDVPYAMFQEKGTRGSTAAPGKVLRFRPKGGGGFVFAKHTAPIQPANFMRDAIRALSPGDYALG